MNWASLVFLGWLQLAYLPSGAIVLYENPFPETMDVAGSGLVDLGVEVTWGIFFAGGAVRIPIWAESGKLSFFPTQLESTVDAGITWEGLRIGWTHTCAHPVVPNLSNLQWSGRQITPRWDSGYDMIYLRIQGGNQ